MENWRKVIKIFADGGFAGKLIGKVKGKFKIEPEIIKRDERHIFKIFLKRCIVVHLRQIHGLIPIEEIRRIMNGLIIPV